MPKTLQKLEEIQIQQNKNIPYASEADFSTHELIEHLLKQTGPAAVRISSFSITEIAIRSFLRLRESGLITELTCLFDLTVKRHRLGILFFTSNIVNEVRLAKIHAKLIFIDNADWNLVVITSSNLNVNDKMEVGLVISNPEEYRFYSDCFDKWFDNALKIDPDEFN